MSPWNINITHSKNLQLHPIISYYIQPSCFIWWFDNNFSFSYPPAAGGRTSCRCWRSRCRPTWSRETAFNRKRRKRRGRLGHVLWVSTAKNSKDDVMVNEYIKINDDIMTGAIVICNYMVLYVCMYDIWWNYEAIKL